MARQPRARAHDTRAARRCGTRAPARGRAGAAAARPWRRRAARARTAESCAHEQAPARADPRAQSRERRRPRAARGHAAASLSAQAPGMKPSIAAKLAQLRVRLEELNHLLGAENLTSNMENYRKLTREHAEIAPVVELYESYRRSEEDIQAAQEMVNDPAMREFAEAEIRDTRERLTQLESDLQHHLLPKDPNDDRNIFLV